MKGSESSISSSIRINTMVLGARKSIFSVVSVEDANKKTKKIETIRKIIRLKTLTV